MNPDILEPKPIDLNTLNRKELRKLGKKVGQVPEKREIKDIGECYVCRKHVFVGEGQLLKYYMNEPTHKVCRKALTKK